MTVYPAIDLRGGRCVRLLQGAFERETVYGDDPVAVARGFEAVGARWLHVVDLDGARAGHPVQHELVARICAAVHIPVQLGGGLRDRAAIVYTDIARDGTERGPDLERTSAIARAAGVPVIASGGIGSLDDVRAVAARAADGVAGMIIGRALYTGAIRLEDALAAAGDR